MERHVNKYRVQAALRGEFVEWSLAVETDDGERYTLPIRDGADIPVLMDLLRRDASMMFDSEKGVLSSGWNDPGQ